MNSPIDQLIIERYKAQKKMEDEGLDDERISIRKAERKKEEETVILQGLEFEGNIFR